MKHELNDEWAKYHSPPETYDVMNALVNIIAFLKIRPNDFEVLDSISKYLLSVTAEGTKFSESPTCPELRELIVKFDSHIRSISAQ
jgi:hypothetical protein